MPENSGPGDVVKEAWSSFAEKINPSQGEYSGGFGKGGTISGGSQWIRQFSLVLYGAQSSGSGAAGDGGKTASGSGSAGGKAAREAPATRDPAGGSDSPPAASSGSGSSKASKGSVNAKGDMSGGKAGEQQKEGLELGALRVTFNLHKNTLETPNMLEARIFNMSPKTMEKITQFTRVQVSAGYKYGQYGMIFDGEVVQYRKGRENQTDTYFEIKAADGQISDPVSFHRFDPPAKESDALKQFVKDSNIPAGHISDKVGTDKLQRPWIMAGSTQNYIRQLMLKYDAQCWPDMNKLYVVPQREYLPGEAVVLSPQTGLVGIPEATPAGMQIRCLLNPRLRMGGLVKLDKTLISGLAYIPGTASQEMTLAQLKPASGALIKGQNEILNPTSPIGLYKIYTMEISGDTRGTPWYCDLICLGLDSDGKTPLFIAGSVFTRQG